MAGADWVLLGALLVFVTGLCLQPITESDLFFRLKVGQEILARGELLGRNTFSFTAPDHPDLDLAWGFEVTAALLYRAGGFAAIVVAKTIWLVGVFTGAFIICRRRGGGPLATTLVLAGAAIVMRERFVERPHVVSFAGELVVLAVIGRLDQKISVARGLAFAAAMVVWANGHAGVFAGVVMLFLAAFAATAFARDGLAARRGLVLAGVVAVAACLTPVGPVGLARYLALHVRLPALHAIDEFRGATWRSDQPFVLWSMLVAAVLLLALAGGRGWRRPITGSPATVILSRRWSATSWADAAVAAGMTVLGFWSVRFAADATLVATPLLVVGASRWTAARDTWGWGDWWGWAKPRRWLRVVAVSVTAGVLVVAALGPRWLIARAGGRPLDLGIDSSTLPLDALKFVDAHGLRERMYNDFEFGSYLLFEGYPRHRVFVDPRLPAYPEDMHRLLGSFDIDRVAWDQAMAKYGVETALLGDAGINRRVALWDPNSWALVYRAHDARVFIRRRDRWRALIAEHEIPATFGFTVERGTTTRLLDDQPARSPVPGCEWQRRLGELAFELDGEAGARATRYFRRALSPPGCLASADEARLAAWMGAADLARGEIALALEPLNRALQLAPGDTRTRANRATAFERAGRRAEAAADWSRVGREAAGTPAGAAAVVRARALAN